MATGTGDIWGRVLAPFEPGGTQATEVPAGPPKLLGVMSDYEVERALVRRIESMSGDEARRWLVRMGRDRRDV